MQRCHARACRVGCSVPRGEFASQIAAHIASVKANRRRGSSRDACCTSISSSSGGRRNFAAARPLGGVVSSNLARTAKPVARTITRSATGCCRSFLQQQTEVMLQWQGLSPHRSSFTAMKQPSKSPSAFPSAERYALDFPSQQQRSSVCCVMEAAGAAGAAAAVAPCNVGRAKPAGVNHQRRSTTAAAAAAAAAAGAGESSSQQTNSSSSGSSRSRMLNQRQPRGGAAEGPGGRGSNFRSRRKPALAFSDKWEKKKEDGEDGSVGGGVGGREERRRRSRIEKEAVVDFVGPMTRQPRVAILGGGMSGVMCAVTLAKEHGIQSTVFDTGKHGLGGRMGTRDMEVFPPRQPGQAAQFDHAAQYFTVSDPRFDAVVRGWLERGIVKEWQGCVGMLQPGGQFSELQDDSPKYIGPRGMRPLVDDILAEVADLRDGSSSGIGVRLVDTARPVWVSRMQAREQKWRLDENGRSVGDFDFVVIAHNGKCANRLLSPAGIPAVAQQMRKLELSAIWCSMVAFDQPLPVPTTAAGRHMEAAFVKGVPALAWMANNTAKLSGGSGSSSSRSATGTDGGSGAAQCWTLFSTGAYGKKHKVPQENIPLARAARVKEDMLNGVALALGVSLVELPNVLHHRVQLWGAALPLNAPGVEFICDATSRVAMCGDWLLAPSVEAAAISGMSLAHHIARFASHGADSPQDFNVGLTTRLQPTVGAHDIGLFASDAGQVSDSVREKGFQASEGTEFVNAVQNI